MYYQICFVGFILHCLMAGVPAHAFEQTFESCSLTAWETLKVVKLFQDDVTIDKAVASSANKRNVEIVYEVAGTEGVATARMAALSSYATCTRNVRARTGVKNLSEKELSSYKCAHAAATNFIILSKLNKGDGLEALRRQFPASLHDLIAVLHRKVEERSFSSALSDVTRSTQSCIEGL